MTTTKFETRGKEIRNLCKDLVLDFMHATNVCQPGKEGMTGAEDIQELRL